MLKTYPKLGVIFFYDFSFYIQIYVYAANLSIVYTPYFNLSFQNTDLGLITQNLLPKPQV